MTGFIYFIRCGEFVKIGFSKQPKARLRHLATATPLDLSIIATIPGTQADEIGIHKWLSDHHHRREWFHWHQDVENIILHGIPHFDHQIAKTPSMPGWISMLTTEDYLAEIEAFLLRSGMSATAFGRDCAKDPNLVRDLRTGRAPNMRLFRKMSDFIRSHDNAPATASEAAE